LRHIFLCLCLLAGINAIAQSVEVNGIFYNFSETEDIAEVTTGTYSGNVIIPESVEYDGKTYAVTSIGSYAFYSQGNLTSVVIPASVKSIGEDAFCLCRNLASVTIPEGVETIGAYAFYSCSSLPYVTLPETVTEIGHDAFCLCRGLTSINIPEKVTTINTFTFYACSSLTSIIIPEGVTTLDRDAFSYCTELTSVTIPASVKKIGGYVFYNCNKLSSVNIPEGLETIEDNTFRNCSALTSITIPANITVIGEEAFAGCSSLTSIVFPENVKEIGGSAFLLCKNLASVTIPSNIESIGASAFTSCSKLKTVTIDSEAIAAKTYNNTNNFATIFGTNVEEYIFGNNVSKIGKYACYNSTGLATVTLPTSVTVIDDCAFQNCSNLSAVTIPASVTVIGERVFQNCTKLEDINVPESVTRIGRFAFAATGWYISQPANMLVYAGKMAYSYKGIIPEGTLLVFEDGTIGIADEAFKGSTGLAAAIMPSSMKYIGASAFAGCSNMSSVSLPNGLKTIGSDAFSKTALLFLTIPEGVESIESSTFSGCASLTNVTFASSVKSIGANAFDNCIGLTAINLPNGLTAIGNEAFAGCAALAEISIPENLACIGNNAFNNTPWFDALDDGLIYAGKVAYKYKGTMPRNAKIEIEEGTLGIAGGAFDGLANLVAITIPASLTNIGELAFNKCSNLKTLNISDLSAWCRIAFEASTAQPLTLTHQLTLNGQKITNLVIPSDVTEILKNTFSGCTDLTTVTIHEYVKSVGSYAFANCNKITDVYCYPVDVPETDADAFTGVAQDKVRLTVPNNSIEKYRSHDVWGKFMMDGSGVSDSGSNETAIRSAHALEGVAPEIYDLNGRKQNALQHGLNIIRSADGTTKKVLVK
jgi:hypothetical protein